MNAFDTLTHHRDIDYQRLFDASPGLFLVLDRDFDIVAVTDAYLTATMTQRNDLVSNNLFSVFPDNPDDPTADGEHNLRASLQRVLDERRADTLAVQKYDIQRPESEGGGFEVRYWSPINSPILNADGEVELIIHRVEDVTEFVQLQSEGSLQRQQFTDLNSKTQQMESDILARSAELQRANNQLRQFDQLKTDLLNTVSHEFRTPLTLQIGPLQDALSDETNILPPRQRDRIEIVQRNSHRLLRLVNTMLDFSQIEAGTIEPSPERVDLAEFTAQIASNFSSAFEAAQLDFTVDCQPLSRVVYVDTAMWEKIVMNLLANALKHTFSGGVTISLSEQSDEIQLVVSDTGIGIPEDQLCHVFDRFHRVRGARSRSHEGSGIGLALVQELAGLLDGGASIESTVDVGTTVTVAIPIIEPSDSPAGINGSSLAREMADNGSRSFTLATDAARWVETPMGATVPPHKSRSSSEKILLVDDNSDMQNYISGILSDHWSVDVASNGAEALRRVRDQHYDLIISDVMMPVMDGIELLHHLRADEEKRDLPVILLSAGAADDAVVHGLQSGASDYIVKPFSTPELLARVNAHLERCSAIRELKTANELKGKFVAIANHELRTPLVAILGFTELLLMQWKALPDDEAHRYITIIDEQAKRLNEMVKSMLSVSKIEAGIVSPSVKRLDLAATVRATISEMNFSDTELRSTPQSGTAHVVADEGHLKQMLINLISNALAYGEPPVYIDITDNGEFLIFSVSDCGTGIPENKREQLFQSYSRIGASDSSHGGMGLGLSIVHGLATANGGDCWYEPNEPEGARFSVQIPKA